MRDFERFLLEVFLKEHPETLDDDIPDKFDAWLSTKDTNEIIEYGNAGLFPDGKEYKLFGDYDPEEELNKIIKKTFGRVK